MANQNSNSRQNRSYGHPSNSHNGEDSQGGGASNGGIPLYKSFEEERRIIDLNDDRSRENELQRISSEFDIFRSRKSLIQNRRKDTRGVRNKSPNRIVWDYNKEA